MSDDAITKPTEATEVVGEYFNLVASWVAETIPELEAGIHDGTLADKIEQPDVQEVIGPALVKRYRIIASQKLAHDPVFRRNWTQEFVEAFQTWLQAPKRLFPARAAIGGGKWTTSEPPPLVASHVQGDVTLRRDQVLSARRWGCWFTFDDELLEHAYNAFLVRKSLQFLESNISNLWNIEATFLSGQSQLSTTPSWHWDSRGGQFEHLMLDVLNEPKRFARAAPLAEDILERTDLRVIYPALNRNEGARVQVSLTADLKLHDEKVQAMYLPEEFILLTPLELARCAVHPPTSPQFSNFAWSAFWTSLGGPWRDVHALALEMQDMFVETLRFPVGHPLGPMSLLSPSMRQFIRTFTEHHATKTTNCVRERLRTSRTQLSSVDRYTSPYWIAKFAQAAAKPGSAAQALAANQTAKE